MSLEDNVYQEKQLPVVYLDEIVNFLKKQRVRWKRIEGCDVGYGLNLEHYRIKLWFAYERYVPWASRKPGEQEPVVLSILDPNADGDMVIYEFRDNRLLIDLMEYAHANASCEPIEIDTRKQREFLLCVDGRK